MKNVLLLLLLLIQFKVLAQEKYIYYRGDKKIDASFIDENVEESMHKINTIFHFRNGTKHYYVKIMNVEGKVYAQGISEYITMDFNSKKGGDLHRKVEKLTHIKIENGKFTSDQLTASFSFLKEKGVKYEKMMPPIKLMICTKGKNEITTCRLNDDDIEATVEEFPGKYPHGSLIRLGDEELRNKKPKELSLMRKEIYARYGYNFPDREDSDYFFSQNWYEPIVDNKMIELNELEEDNIAMISLYEGANEYESLNNKSFSHIFSIETTSSTLYDKDALKSIKYMKQDSINGNKCFLTEFNKKGISTAKTDCLINKPIYANYFKNNLLTQHIDQEIDTYFYYNENGLPFKSVKIDYKSKTTQEFFYYYDKQGSIIKNDLYQNNNYNSTLYYDYDSENNLVKEYYKDKTGKEEHPIEYFYDEDQINIGYLKNNLTGCDYSFNNDKDVMTEIQCFKIVNEENIPTTKSIMKVLETNRGKRQRISSVKISELINNKYNSSITEIKYY